MIKLENVNKYFGDLHVLKDVNLEVKEGEKLVIIGPSGSGKSTTVRCMNFLEEPTSGHVYIDGKELTHKNRTHLVRETTSMVFQQFNLYPHMTVLRNLTLAPMKLHHKSRKEAEDTAFHYLDVVGLRDKAHAYPSTLSGGQQQRIAIARALCAQTKIILFDEPTSALDPETIQEVLDVMIKLAKKNITYNYAFVFYDVNEKRVQKIFKICKKYLSHFQYSVFRGEITPSKMIQLRTELEKIIDEEEDLVCMIKLMNDNVFGEETLGKKDIVNGESLII